MRITHLPYQLPMFQGELMSRTTRLIVAAGLTALLSAGAASLTPVVTGPGVIGWDSVRAGGGGSQVIGWD